MLQEHAITYQGRLSIVALEYLTKKANKLGANGREITHVYEQFDEEGTHVFFDVKGKYNDTPRNER